MTRVCVTGGAGFIGANLVRELTRTPQVGAVRVIDDYSTGSADNLAGVAGVDVIEGSILDPDAMTKAVEGVDAIVHLAARPSVPRSIADPEASHRVNATGTLEVLEAARRVGHPHVIVASSSSVYGANPVLPKREDLATLPRSPYAASKLAAEAYALAYAASFDLPVLAFRFFNVFGPLQPAGHAYAAVVPAFVSAALEGRALPVHGDGTQTRDFTFVGSVCRVIREAIVRRVSHPTPVNLAFGSRRSLLDLIEEIRRQTSLDLQVEHLPPRPGDVPHSQADASTLRSLFPDVEPVPFGEGLGATIHWFRTGAVQPETAHGDDVTTGTAPSALA